jgi:hypothetical protein
MLVQVFHQIFHKANTGIVVIAWLLTQAHHNGLSEESLSQGLSVFLAFYAPHPPAPQQSFDGETESPTGREGH